MKERKAPAPALGVRNAALLSALAGLRLVCPPSPILWITPHRSKDHTFDEAESKAIPELREIFPNIYHSLMVRQCLVPKQKALTRVPPGVLGRGCLPSVDMWLKLYFYSRCWSGQIFHRRPILPFVRSFNETHGRCFRVIFDLQMFIDRITVG